MNDELQKSLFQTIFLSLKRNGVLRERRLFSSLVLTVDIKTNFSASNPFGTQNETGNFD
jgi:hypothetical protein